MRVPILMPQLGESIAEATVRDIKIEIGQQVTADEDLLEVETEKAMMEVTTPCPGEILEIIAEIENRALAAARALPEPGWRLQKRLFSRFSF